MFSQPEVFLLGMGFLAGLYCVGCVIWYIAVINVETAVEKQVQLINKYIKRVPSLESLKLDEAKVYKGHWFELFSMMRFFSESYKRQCKNKKIILYMLSMLDEDIIKEVMADLK